MRKSDEPPSITDALIKQKRTEFLKALQATDLNAMLDGTSEDQFFVFAPSDEALNSFNGTDLATVKQHKELLKQLMEFHIINGKTAGLTLAKSKSGKFKTLLPNHKVSIVIAKGAITQIQKHMLTDTDTVKCKNGIVYLMDHVLDAHLDLPASPVPTMTVEEITFSFNGTDGATYTQGLEHTLTQPELKEMLRQYFDFEAKLQLYTIDKKAKPKSKGLGTGVIIAIVAAVLVVVVVIALIVKTKMGAKKAESEYRRVTDAA